LGAAAAQRAKGQTVEVTFPTLHASQVEAWEVIHANRFTMVRAGRRWGKTDLCKTIVGDRVLRGQTWGWFAPDYKRLSEAYNELATMLKPMRANANKMEGVYRTLGGGRVDWWTLEDESAGRSRKYHGVVVDEGAFTKNNMMQIWERSIKPTLLDYGGKAIVASNTNGNAEDNFLYQLSEGRPYHTPAPKYGFVDFHATSFDNPHLPAEELAKLERDNHPLVFQQEYLAEFVDWSGVAFFQRDKMLVDGKPVAYPAHCDAVFTVIDTASKTGTDNDGTAATHYAKTRPGLGPHPLVILDWDIQQIEGAMLEEWLPTVFEQGRALAKRVGSRHGYLGAFIEDKDSGVVLLQQARRHGWPATAIESKLTALGKDGRAISVSGYVYRGEVKFSAVAFEKTTTYKGTTRNHLWTQVVGFRVGDKDAAKRADDLLDTFTYGVALSQGDSEGF
jgi:hypothetical protein